MSQVTITMTHGPAGTTLTVDPMMIQVDEGRTLNWVLVPSDTDWVFDAAGVVIAGPNDVMGGDGFLGWPQGQQPQFVSDTEYSVQAPPDKPVENAAKYRYTISLVNKTTKAKIRWDPDIEDRP